jgi:hypothetical protein
MTEDFDFLIGQWQVINTRLKDWLCECNEWITFESYHLEQKRSSGSGNFAVHQYTLGNAQYERSILRQYDNRYEFWKIDRIDTMSALTMPSLKGTFWNNKGSFLSKGFFHEQEVLIWVENNWVMEFFRDKNRSIK